MTSTAARHCLKAPPEERHDASRTQNLLARRQRPRQSGPVRRHIRAPPQPVGTTKTDLPGTWTLMAKNHPPDHGAESESRPGRTQRRPRRGLAPEVPGNRPAIRQSRCSPVTIRRVTHVGSGNEIHGSIGTRKPERRRGTLVERVIFIDPFTADERPSMASSKGPSPVPAPPTKPVPASQFSPSRGREREVQQLIHDLAILAARHPPVT